MLYEEKKSENYSDLSDFQYSFDVQDVKKELSKVNPCKSMGPDGIHPKIIKSLANNSGTHSLEHEEMWPLSFTNITGHIEPILEQNHYCDDNVLNLKRHSGNMSFVRPLDLLRFSCNQ